MHTSSCANCGHSFRQEDVYCSQCSQKADTHRLTIGHLFHELFHAVTHADKSILVLVRELSLRPGKVAREYAEGRRKKYFNPFTFVLICLSVFVFLNSSFHTMDAPTQPDPQVLQQLPNQAAKDSYLKILQRTADFSNLILKRNNLIYMLAIPLYAAILWLFFRRRTFAEHLVANMYFNAFLALMTSLLIMPLVAVFKTPLFGSQIFLLIFLIQLLYLSWAYYGFLEMKKKRAAIKIFSIIFLIFLVWIALMGVTAFYYIFGDNMGTVLKGMLKKYQS